LELENNLRREIKEKERSLLFEVIPALRRIIGGDFSPIDENNPNNCEDQTKISGAFDSNSRAHKLYHAIKKFVSVISAVGDIIVFLLDDLQVRYFNLYILLKP
jgi:hypothetical protein